MAELAPHPPRYYGHELVSAALPRDAAPWASNHGAPTTRGEITHEELATYVAGRQWCWPDRPIFFVCDVHADADAFMSSLVASGGIQRTGHGEDDFVLTEEGRAGLFIIGGDCFDKGPSNLALLRALYRLIEKQADVVILAGNHDVRTVLGLRFAGHRDPRHAHLLVRLGKKSVRLFQEVCDEHGLYSEGSSAARERAIERSLYPAPSWFEDFPSAVAGLMTPKQVEKELRRIREKQRDFTASLAEAGLTFAAVEKAIEKCRELFLDPRGEFSWFYRRMTAALRVGSLLFVHAGVDDVTAALVRESGIDGLNERFFSMSREDPFLLYHGPLGSAFRTKYRNVDFPLTQTGAEHMREAGIAAVVHGHRNLMRGQRMTLRQGLLHFECDASVDRNTRARMGLGGPGAAATVFRPDGTATAISTDHPTAKVFALSRFGAGPALSPVEPPRYGPEGPTTKTSST